MPPPLRPGVTQLCVYVPTDLADKIRVTARLNRLTVSDLARKLLTIGMTLDPRRWPK